MRKEGREIKEEGKDIMEGRKGASKEGGKQGGREARRGGRKKEGKKQT